MATATKVQFNPSTLKASYNPDTDRVQAFEAPVCPCFPNGAPYWYTLTFSGITDCAGGDDCTVVNAKWHCWYRGIYGSGENEYCQWAYNDEEAVPPFIEQIYISVYANRIHIRARIETGGNCFRGTKTEDCCLSGAMGNEFTVDDCPPGFQEGYGGSVSWSPGKN